MKIRTLMIMPLISLLATPIFNTMAGTSKGSMTLTLTGEIDMNINPAQAQQVNASLSGTTNFTGTPIYSTDASSSWADYYAIISLSQSQTRCNGNFVEKIPNQNAYGLLLTHSSNTNTKVYVTPKFNFNVVLSSFSSSYANNYAGSFFQSNSGVKDTQTPNQYVCFVPSNTSLAVPAGGTKNITITTPSTLPLYIDENLTPGKLSYQGTVFYVGSFGKQAAGDFYTRVSVTADILVKRSCTVTGLTNQQINENMTETNEVIRDSQFTLSCGGLGNPVNMSAVIKEGTIDSTNPNKLVLAPINGTVSDKKPWVMGLPYIQTATPNLTCADENNNKLLKFNGAIVQMEGTNMGNNKPDQFGIKWALCKPDNTKAGEYRGKVDVNIFVRG